LHPDYQEYRGVGELQRPGPRKNRKENALTEIVWR